MFRRSTLLAAGGATLLMLSVGTLAALLVDSMTQAARLFDRAAASQAQFAGILAIRGAARAADQAGIAVALARYRRDIAAESALLGDAYRAEQRREEVEADAIASIAMAMPPRFGELSRVVDAIALRERGEARQTGRDLADLRRRSRAYTVLLAASAAIAALIGAVGLIGANWRLSRLVLERTAQLEQVDASRRLFFAKVSHELRTPVTVMRGEAEVALATSKDDPAILKSALTQVVDQSEQLNHRVGELLALSHAKDGRLTLTQAPLDLAELLQATVARNARHAELNGVSLSLAPVLPITVRGDARWLEQALIAVLDNAIKFSPAGGIVEVAAGAVEGTAEITVADRGAGLHTDTLPRLFDAYYQTEEGRARGGSGLGLALVRWTAEQHGGIARAASRDGGGCVVTIALPVAA